MQALSQQINSSREEVYLLSKHMVEEAIRKLESSNIAKSRQHRLMILVNDIANNRYRIQSIFNHLVNVQDKQYTLNILKLLCQDKLLSDEQFEKICEMEDVDLPVIATVVK